MITKSNNLYVRSYNFSVGVVNLVKSFPAKPIYWTFSDQLVRSATSIGANLHESKSASSKKDFINFQHIALKSAHETNYWLSLLKDTNLVSEKEISFAIVDVVELIRMITSSLKKLKLNG